MINRNAKITNEDYRLFTAPDEGGLTVARIFADRCEIDFPNGNGMNITECDDLINQSSVAIKRYLEGLARYDSFWPGDQRFIKFTEVIKDSTKEAN